MTDRTDINSESIDATQQEHFDKLLGKARRYCATAEQCESAVRQKLASWGASHDEADEVVERLQRERYIDDERYAVAYCESKILLQHWSRYRVAYELRLKRLPGAAIERGLGAVADEAYLRMLRELEAKKLRELGGTDDAETARRLMAYLLGRGFTADEIDRARRVDD